MKVDTWKKRSALGELCVYNGFSPDSPSVLAARRLQLGQKLQSQDSGGQSSEQAQELGTGEEILEGRQARARGPQSPYKLCVPAGVEELNSDFSCCLPQGRDSLKFEFNEVYCENLKNNQSSSLEYNRIQSLTVSCMMSRRSKKQEQGSPDLIVAILGFVGHMISVAATQLYCCSVKVALDGM